MDDRQIKLTRFIQQTNKAYKLELAQMGRKFAALKMDRFSSGILSLDLALGGGWPFSRIAMIAGEESTGKTLITIKAAASVEEYDHITKKHKSEVEEKKFRCGRCLIIDVEGAYDIDWAESNGLNPDLHVVVRPECSEQTIDIVTNAIQENIFDLIIVDSIAAMTPGKEIEEGSESWQMGLAARLNNKAFRAWNAKLNKLSSTSIKGPLLLCLNQFRINIGQMFGDPRTLPGGRAQKFCTSIIIYTKSQKFKDTKDAEIGEVELQGVTKKNKTYVLGMPYSFKLKLKTAGEEVIGTIDNIDQLAKYGQKYKLITKSGSKYMLAKKEYRSLDELKVRLSQTPTLYDSLWKAIIKAAIK